MIPVEGGGEEIRNLWSLATQQVHGQSGLHGLYIYINVKSTGFVIVRTKIQIPSLTEEARCSSICCDTKEVEAGRLQSLLAFSLADT